MNTNTQSNLDAIKRLLDRKQSVPTMMVRNLASDCNVYRMLSISQAKRIAELEAELKALKEGTK